MPVELTTAGEASASPAKKPRRQYATKRSHPTYVIETCPNCQFPEADGGYCEDCGWTRSCSCAFCSKQSARREPRQKKGAA